MTNIRELFAKTFAARLQRSTIKTCSDWAKRYRVMGEPFPGKWSFDRHPWLLEMHDADVELVIGQKAAQMGYTEWAMNSTFYYMDSRSFDVLYILPTTSDAGDFSNARFDPALEASAHLRNFFNDVDNVGLKRAGSRVLYVRGSHARSRLKSIPVAITIFDEVDEMPRESIDLAAERQSGAVFTRTLMLSTPTIANRGINGEFRLSTEEYYHFQCPSCHKYTTLVYPDSIKITADALTDPGIKNSYYICKECNATLPHETKQDWLKPVALGGKARFIPTHSGRPARGFHVSQMYSMAKGGVPGNFAFAALKAGLDPTYAQEFYNSKLGLPHTAAGAKITLPMIDAVKRGYRKRTIVPEKPRTLGIDVGSVLHMVVKEWTQSADVAGLDYNDQYTPRVVFEGTSSGSAMDFDEAYQLFYDLHVTAGVVDAEPERRAALQFAQRLNGRVLLCDYQSSQSGRSVIYNEDELTLKVNRTSWLDLTFSRYKRGAIELPADVSDMFCAHIQEPTRVQRTDRWGNPYAIYVNVGADHFAHASNYAEIALPWALGLGQNANIVDMY